MAVGWFCADQKLETVRRIALDAIRLMDDKLSIRRRFRLAGNTGLSTQAHQTRDTAHARALKCDCHAVPTTNHKTQTNSTPSSRKNDESVKWVAGSSIFLYSPTHRFSGLTQERSRNAFVTLVGNNKVIASVERIEGPANGSDFKEVYGTEYYLLYAVCKNTSHQLLPTSCNAHCKFS